jgi:pimeloyl-ACP methyl ester carboxylesterase
MAWQQPAAGAPPQQVGGRRVALTSTEVECVVVKAGMSDSPAGAVKLAWQGQIEEAFLVASVAGSTGGHGIYVNGRLVGAAPVQPNGQLCDPGFEQAIPIPADLLVQGENIITLTNNANINDSWTAAGLHLEIHGVLSGPATAALEAPSGSEIQALGVSGKKLLASSYEGGTISQAVYYYVPGSYTGASPVPLVVVIHGMGQNGKGMRNLLAPEAEERGWLVASPDMHGNYYVTDGKYALAWPGAQHDIIDTIAWMIGKYKVDKSRIYITGGSMGGQTTAMMAAKYPDIFAAAAPWKPLTNLTSWYNERAALLPPDGPNEGNKHIRRETGAASNAGTQGTTPTQAPFEYQRRSPVELPQNSRLMPLKLWHGLDDLLVPIHHSRDLKNAITAWNPLVPISLIEVNNSCPSDTYHHCYNPNQNDLFDFLQSYSRNSAPPSTLHIRTDESKSYYWLKLVQSGPEHWSQVSVTYQPATQKITAVISDNQLLTLGFNLGSIPIKGAAGITQAGLGASATQYRVEETGAIFYSSQLTYTPGSYLMVTLHNTGQVNLTISPITTLPLTGGGNQGFSPLYLPVVVK